MRIGDIEIHPVFDGVGHEIAREVLVRPGKPDPWSCHSDLLDAHGRLELPVGGFLVRTCNRTVLVDAGVGGIDNGRYTGGRLLESLRDLGVAPEQVTDVLLTHLHFDHVGWTTRGGQIVFPRATYRVHAADWAHFVDAPDAAPGAVRKLSPLAGQLEPFDAAATLLPGIDALPCPGHTPGSSSFAVSSRGERALLIGDVAHSVVELTESDWEFVHDIDRVAAREVRARLADELADTTNLVAAAHFPRLSFGRLVTTGGRRQLVFV